MPTTKLAKVFKSNELNQSNFADFSLSAYRVFLNLITKIQRYDNGISNGISDVANREYALSATEYAEEFHIPRNTAYVILKEVVDKLLKTSFSLPVEAGLLKINVCSQALYIKDKGQIKVRFTEEIMPHLAEIKNRFTMYNLCEISGFNSIYTTRFYELLMQYKTTGILVISVAKLRNILGCIQNYKLYNDFKRHGFGHAVNEINSHYDIGITFREVKEGRAVDRLEFTFKKALKNQVYDPVLDKMRTQFTRPLKKNAKKINEKKGNALPEESIPSILEKPSTTEATTNAREALRDLAERLRLNKA